MAIERIWDIQGFSGGESDDAFRWPKDSFYSGENINIRKNLSGFWLSSKLNDTGWTIDGDISYMENLEKFGLSWIVVCTTAGKVYLDGTLKQTISTGTTNWNIIHAMGTVVVSWVQYIYYVTRTASWVWKIHRSTTDLATFSISHATITTTTLAAFSGWAYTIQTSAGTLFIAINNMIVSLDTAEAVTVLLTLPRNETIVWFTEFQNNYKIYSNLGSSGIQYLWDGWDATDYRQVWLNSIITWVVNNGAYDYAIIGSESYSDLYLISGTQKQELRVNLEAATSSRTFTWYMSVREDIVYISGWLSGESSNYGIYSYGNYYPGTAKSLVQEYSLSTNKFLWHVHSSNRWYFANTDDKVYYVDYGNPPGSYATTGYIVTQMYEWNILEEKAIRKIKIGYNISNDTIAIYLRKELWASWVLAKTLTSTDYWTKHTATIGGNEIMALWTGNFWTLQMKIEITASLSWPTSWQQTCVKRVVVYMDAVNPNQ